MGSRGRMLGRAHWNLPSQYKCVDIINNTKVLEYQSSAKHHKNCQISPILRGTVYILKDKNGMFHRLRIYDYSGHPVVDIDYGVHKQYGNEPTLHIH